MNRTSIICNDFVEEIKNNKNETAFFFEQDYNLVIVRTSKLLQFINKRFELAYARFIRNKVHFKKEEHIAYLYEDFLSEQAESYIRLILNEE